MVQVAALDGKKPRRMRPDFQPKLRASAPAGMHVGAHFLSYSFAKKPPTSSSPEPQ